MQASAGDTAQWLLDYVLADSLGVEPKAQGRGNQPNTMPWLQRAAMGSVHRHAIPQGSQHPRKSGKIGPRKGQQPQGSKSYPQNSPAKLRLMGDHPEQCSCKRHGSAYERDSEVHAKGLPKGNAKWAALTCCPPLPASAAPQAVASCSSAPGAPHPQ